MPCKLPCSFPVAPACYTRPVAHNMGQRVRGYRHVYHVFGPIFLFKWVLEEGKQGSVHETVVVAS